MIATVFPLVIGYVVIALGAAQSILESSEQSLFSKVLATLPFVAVHGIVAADLIKGSGERVSLPNLRIDAYLTESLEKFGRPDFEKKCDYVRSLRLRLYL